MTADILHAGFNIFKNFLLKKKKDATEFGEKVKKNLDSIYKNVPQQVDDGSKNKRKESNLSGTSFLNNIEILSARKISTHVILTSMFPSIYFIGTNALNKLFVLFTEESWSISSLMSQFLGRLAMYCSNTYCIKFKHLL